MAGMKRLAVIDQAIIDWLSRRCASIQEWTGWDCFDVALALGVLRAALFAAMPDWVDAALAGGLTLLLLPRAFRVRHDSSSGLRNPGRVDQVDMVIRIASASLIVGSVSWLAAAHITLFVAQLYLIACDPLPPCKGKFWERIEASRMRTIQVPD